MKSKLDSSLSRDFVPSSVRHLRASRPDFVRTVGTGGSRGLACAALLAMTLVAGSAGAEVVREGSWPAQDPKVSLTLGRVPREEALQKLAAAAGWSIVFAQDDHMVDPIIVNMTDVPATTALDALLMGGAWTAKRDGSLVRIERRDDDEKRGSASGPTPPTPPTPLTPPTPPTPLTPPDAPTPPAAVTKPSGPGSSVRHRDVVVTGESVRIAKGDTVHDVTVMGGSADVEGHLTGDLAVIGGSARVHAGAQIDGDASAVGGSITVDEGARVDGDLSVVGGLVHGGENAKGRGVKIIASGEPDAQPESLATRASRAVQNAVSSAALLFVLGAMLIALAGERFDQLRGEIAARPMRSLAVGVLGFLGSLLTIVVLCVTIIGIPFAAIGVVVFVFAIFAGTAAAATTAGAAIAGHRVKSPYGHLAIGCAIYLVAGLVPWVGPWIQLAILASGFGSIVATRAAGLIRRKAPAAQAVVTPYR